MRTSAIRYYERLGILLPPSRVSGQRRYGSTVVPQLAVLKRAQDVGFTLDEIRRLFFGFPKSTPISARWQELAATKLAELDAKLEQIKSMKALLQRLKTNCHCDTVERCGAKMVQAGCAD